MSQDHAKPRYIVDLIPPGLVFVQDREVYARALAALDLTGVLLVHVDRAPPQMQSLPWSELVATKPTGGVARSIALIEPETVGKLLFTSGSTGTPKAVIETRKPTSQQSPLRLRNQVRCCKDELIAPERSEYRDGTQIRHLWYCSNCETSFGCSGFIPVEAVTADDCLRGL